MQKRRLISYNNNYLSLDYRIYLSDVDLLIQQLNELINKVSKEDIILVSPSQCDFIIYETEKRTYQLNMTVDDHTLSFYINLDDDNICQQFKYTMDDHSVLSLSSICFEWIKVVIFLLVFQQRLRKSVSYGV